MDNILVYSSLIFLTNTAVAYYYGHYMYSFFFGMLTATSVIVHSRCSDPLLSTVLDKLAILSVVLYGGHILFSKMSATNAAFCIVIVATFFSTAYLYAYGFLVDDYCFNSDKRVANKYHCLLHCLSSTGHHLITVL